MISDKDKARVKKWVEDNKEHVKEYQKKYSKKHCQKDSEKARKRKWREENVEYHTEYNKRLYGTKELKARQMAQKIKIIEGTLCESCNEKPAVDRHHPNYDEPMNVVLLCEKCHQNIHSVTKCAPTGQQRR